MYSGQKIRGDAPRPNGRVRLVDLAEQLGLTKGTVSRALNGFPEVSEATRKRVAAAAEQHNYRPNTRAKALYQAFGFEGEGTIRGYARRPGGFADAHVMGRLSPTSQLRKSAQTPEVAAL